MFLAVRRALISVSDKTHLLPLAQTLKAHHVDILSTGGTAAFLKGHDIPVTMVSEITGFPEIMDGRVKTLHPKIHGALLARRDEPRHLQAMREHDITPIDLAVINLYPFEATVEAHTDFAISIENIDIGGPAMIRAAAKNHDFVAIVTDPKDYDAIIAGVKEHGLSLEHRRNLAQKAFAHTAAYDSAIANWFAAQEGQKFPDPFLLTGNLAQRLRYGENPHQEAALYRWKKGHGLPQAQFLQGKELSYNNLADGDAALSLLREFSEPAAIIVKHANPCGAALGAHIGQAYEKALAADPLSAFGGIVALNRPVGGALGKELARLFLEMVIAPDFSEEALSHLRMKKNLRLLKLPIHESGPRLLIKMISGGFLVQESDMGESQDWKNVTKIEVSRERIPDLRFASQVVKHVSSNAIVIAKNGQTLGIGAGQMSRVDSVRIAVNKAGDRARGAVLASDAFFPFADGIHEAAEAGIAAIIQPGGSQRDQEVIAACDEHRIAMILTGQRHFRH